MIFHEALMKHMNAYEYANEWAYEPHMNFRLRIWTAYESVYEAHKLSYAGIHMPFICRSYAWDSYVDSYADSYAHSYAESYANSSYAQSYAVSCAHSYVYSYDIGSYAQSYAHSYADSYVTNSYKFICQEFFWGFEPSTKKAIHNVVL